MSAPAAGAADFRAALPGGVAIFVPDTLECLTTFTLRERGDWFEDELRWVRGTFGAGLRAIDVGASFGCWALSLAALAGPRGRVWAYEPNPACAGRLRRSAAENHFDWLDVRDCAVADAPGRAVFSSSAEQTESGGLAGGVPTGAAATWEVALATLDVDFPAASGPGVDFIKLDAEGAELRVLAGAENFLARTDPLILAELRHGAAVNEPLLRAFAERGFDLYRLAPGPGVLVPFRAEDAADRFLLNVFAARPAMAAKLAAVGRLERDAAAPEPSRALERWSARPYARALALPAGGAEFSEAWTALQDSTDGRRAARLARVLAAWTRDPADANPWRLQSAARVAEALGFREWAVGLLRRARRSFAERGAARPTELFLPAAERFEALAPTAEKFDDWAKAAVADALDRLERYCGWFQPPTLNDLQREVMAAGFADEAMQRRVTLVRRRALAREAAAKPAPAQ